MLAECFTAQHRFRSTKADSHAEACLSVSRGEGCTSSATWHWQSTPIMHYSLGTTEHISHITPWHLAWHSTATASNASQSIRMWCISSVATSVAAATAAEAEARAAAAAPLSTQLGPLHPTPTFQCRCQCCQRSMHIPSQAAAAELGIGSMRRKRQQPAAAAAAEVKQQQK